MATTRTIEKLDGLVGVTDLTNAELKFVLNNWDDAPRKVQTQVVRTFKDLPKIPPALQCLFIEMDPRAAKTIGELMCVEAQELILGDKAFADDVAVLIAKAHEFKAISEALWKALAMRAKRGELKAVAVKRLAARKDVHPNFLKLAGLTANAAVKEQKRREVAEAPVRRPRRPVEVEKDVAPVRPRRKSAEAEPSRKQPALRSRSAADAMREVFKPLGKKPVRKVVGTKNVNTFGTDDDFEEDDDFSDVRKVGKSVRKVRRPIV